MTDDHGVVDVSECRGETPLAARRKVYWRTHKHPATHKSSIERRVCHGRIHLQKKKLWAPFRMDAGRATGGWARACVPVRAVLWDRPRGGESIDASTRDRERDER